MNNSDDENGYSYPISQGRVNLNPEMKQALSLPQSICIDYALRGRSATPGHPLQLNAPPLAQYINAEGFCFTWGHILERRRDNQVLWDFCLGPLLERYHQKGLLLVDLQQTTLRELQATIPELVSHEWDATSVVRDGWRLYPGTVISAFSLRCHFTREHEARHWLSGMFLPLLLPGLLYKVQRHVDRLRP